MNISFGLTVDDYSKYRVAYPNELFERLNEKELGIEGKTLLDLGTGVGLLARKLATMGLDVT